MFIESAGKVVNKVFGQIQHVIVQALYKGNHETELPCFNDLVTILTEDQEL